MALPSKSGGFQVAKIEAVSSQLWVDASDIVYFDWCLYTIYTESKAWRNKGWNGQNRLSLQKVSI